MYKGQVMVVRILQRLTSMKMHLLTMVLVRLKGVQTQRHVISMHLLQRTMGLVTSRSVMHLDVQTLQRVTTMLKLE